MCVLPVRQMDYSGHKRTPSLHLNFLLLSFKEVGFNWIRIVVLIKSYCLYDLIFVKFQTKTISNRLGVAGAVL